MIKNKPEYDVVIVGAGFGGIYAMIQARKAGYNVLGIEAAPALGGTWYWNRYPGARCDVESIDYSYSFDPEIERTWRWSERYATQPEILRYLNFVADKYDIHKEFRFNEKLEAAQWDEENHVWRLQTVTGAEETCRWLIMATGTLSTPQLPDIPGIADFKGEVYKTATWPEQEPDLEGKRVALIGTGSSGIQTTPEIVDRVASLHVYQRTPNYSVPAFNRLVSDEEWAELQQDLPERRRISWASTAGSPWSKYGEEYEDLDEEGRQVALQKSWQLGGVLYSKTFERQLSDMKINDAAREFFEQEVAKKVENPKVLEKLIPKGYPIGTKRICTDSGYYESFNLPHVHLVSLPETPIEKFTETGIVTSDGETNFDVIIFATGFDAVTGALTSLELRGREGKLLRDEWSEGYRSYFGLGVPDFPNMIVIHGPGAPNVFANMALGSEQQGDFAMKIINYAAEQNYTSFEVRSDAADEWIKHVQDVADNTLFTKVNSWYTGGNMEGKPSRFLAYAGGFESYNRKVEASVENGFEGFFFSETN